MASEDDRDSWRSNKNSPKSTINLSVIGGAAATIAGQRVLQGKRKALALIAFLALGQQTSVPREYLAGLLWGDSPEKQARASLRQIFSELRQTFGSHNLELLTFDRDSLTLNHTLIEVDLTNLMVDLESGIVPELLTSKPNFTGDILHGYDNLSQDYTTWLREFRARFHDKVSRSLQDSYSSDILPRKTKRRMAEAATLLDVLSEDAHRTSMQLAAEDGDVGSALQTYSKLYQTLDDELGMEPSGRTQDLVVKIKTGHFDSHENKREDGDSPSITESLNVVPLVGNVKIPTVAIIPFELLGPDPIPDYFSLGIIEDTVCSLATLREPRVISSNSTRFLNFRDDLPKDYLANLGANYLVSGSIRKSSDKFHLSVQLTDAETGFVEWAQIYTSTESELFDIQGNIAHNIAHKLVPSLRVAELRRVKGSRPNDLTAYHLTLKARDLVFRLERKSFDEAGEMLQMACRKDPHFAPSFVSMAEWYSVRLGQGWSPDSGDDQQKLEHSARTAISLNEESGRAWALLGHNRTILTRDYQDAQILIARALKCSPNDAETLMWSSPTQAYIGDHEAAIQRAEQAISLSPQDPFLFRYEHFLSMAHYAAEDYAAAAHWGRSSYNRNPHYTSNLRMTAAALAASGSIGESKKFASRVLDLTPEYNVAKYLVNQPYSDRRVGERYAGHLQMAGLP